MMNSCQLGLRVLHLLLFVYALDALVSPGYRITTQLTHSTTFVRNYYPTRQSCSVSCSVGQRSSKTFLKLSNDNVYDNFSDGVFESDGNDNIETGLIIRKNKVRKGDRRDMLPFEIYMSTDENNCMGSYLLDASTACGDLVDLGQKGIFVVKRVIFVYKFTQGALRVCKKKLHLTSAIHNDSSSLLFGGASKKGGGGGSGGSDSSSFQ